MSKRVPIYVNENELKLIIKGLERAKDTYYFYTQGQEKEYDNLISKITEEMERSFEDEQ